MRKVVLVGGKINCGKNQFTQYLDDYFASHFLLEVKQDFFAYSLKRRARNDFRALDEALGKIVKKIRTQLPATGCEHCVERIEPILEELRFSDHNWFEDKTEITRTLLQIYGTEIMRQHVADNYWAADTKKRILADKGTDITIITDFRFPNEAETIRDDSFELYTIRIDRTVDTDDKIASHVSETSLDGYTNWSYIVQNDEVDLEGLEKMAQMVADDIVDGKTVSWPVFVHQNYLYRDGEKN